MKRSAAAVVVVVAIAAAIAWSVWPHRKPVEVRATTSSQVATRGSAARTSAIGGVVVDAAGTPIAGARVCAVHGEAPSCVASDPNGGFSIAALGAATYQMTASSPHLRLARILEIAIEANQQRADVRIELVAGGVEVTGTVSDVGGGPIANALVHMEPNDHGPKSAYVETDKAGHFSLWCSEGEGRVWAAADGYVTHPTYAQAPSTLAIELVPESAIIGKVIDAKTHAPVAGASVHTEFSEAVTTDEAGNFRLGGLATGRYAILASADHRFGISESVSLVVAQHRDGLVIEVHPAARLDARFLVGDKPCAKPGLSVYEGNVNIPAVADATGMHLAVSPGLHAVYPSCAGYVLTDPEHEPLEVGTADLTKVWHFGEGTTVRGIVRDPDGHPARDVSISMGGALGDAVTGDDGAYELRGLVVGEQMITVKSKLGIALENSVVVRAPITTHDIGLVAIGSIDGLVVDQNGRPVADAYVSCDFLSLPSHTHDAGAFHCDVPPGHHKITVDVAGSPAANAEVEVVANKTSSARVVVERGSGTIKGRVVDVSGAPIRDARIDLSSEASSGRSVTSAEDGSFSFSTLRSAEYTISAFVAGRPSTTVENVKLGASVTLAINRGATVEGTVRGPDGPLEDFIVRVRDGDADRFYRTGGRYRFTGLPAGPVVLTAHAGEVEGEITVDAVEGKTVTADIAIDASVTVVGRVVDLNTGPIANAQVEVGKVDGRHHRVETGPDGRFTIQNVSRGPLRCNVGAAHFIFVSFGFVANSAMFDVGDVITAPSRLTGKGAFDTNIEIDEDLKITRAAGSLVVGDVITSVDGVIVTGLHADVARGLMIQMGPGTIKVGVARGVVAAITLVPAD